MKLYDVETISWGKDGAYSLTVRGLNTMDITTLINRNKDQINHLFDQAEEALKEGGDLTAFGMEMLNTFPELVAEMIALASDNPDRAGEILRLPFPSQLKLIEAIYRLTIEDTGGLQDFLSLVFALMKKMNIGTNFLNSRLKTVAVQQRVNTGT